MSPFALSKVLVLTVAVGGALGAFSPPRYAMTSWDTPASSAGVRLYGSTPDRSGILELSLDGQLNANSTPPYPWHANVLLLDTVVTASGSDFAAISTQGGTKVVVFFIRNNGVLSYIQSPSTSTAAWSLGLVGGSPKPAPGTSLGAAMWGPDHMSVFYQGAEGIIFESEYKNGTWATPVDSANANIGTDIHAVGTTSPGLSKFLYLQNLRAVEEWRYSASNNKWTATAIAAFPAQSSDINIRFALAYLANTAYPGRLWYRPVIGQFGFVAGTPGGSWLPPTNATGPIVHAPSSDIAATLQFPATLQTNWQWLVFTGTDNTLQQLPYRAAAGWGVPSQIVPAPNKIQGAA